MHHNQKTMEHYNIHVTIFHYCPIGRVKKTHFTWQVTRETLSSRAGQTNIFQFFVWLATDNNWIFLCGLTLFAGSRSFIISLGTREEVPPPCNFLMARGGGGEVKTRQAEPGGDGGVRGNWDFSSKMPTFLHLHNQLVSCGLAVFFTSMYQFSAGKKVRVKRCEVWGGRRHFWWDVASVESLSPFETFVLCVLSFFSSVLDKEPMGLKVLATVE